MDQYMHVGGKKGGVLTHDDVLSRSENALEATDRPAMLKDASFSVSVMLKWRELDSWKLKYGYFSTGVHTFGVQCIWPLISYYVLIIHVYNECGSKPKSQTAPKVCLLSLVMANLLATLYE